MNFDDAIAAALDAALALVERPAAVTAPPEIPDVGPIAVDTIAGLFGATPREQNPRLAAILAGTSDKRSREYRTAIRNVQRYRASGGRQARGQIVGPTSRLRRAIVRAVEVRPVPFVPNRAARVVIVGMVRVSKDLRRRTVVAVIPASDMRAIVAAHRAGDRGRTAGLFLAAFQRSYSGVPVQFESVESVSIRWA